MNKNWIPKASGIIQLLCAAMILGVMIAIVVVAAGQSARKTFTYKPLGTKTQPILEKKIKSGLNLNTATKSELMELPGIGETTAQAIIESREKGGKFYYIEDLLSVKGVGVKTLQNIRSLAFVP